eukprot:11662086-Heterocapsa_arctica.AAC.1
MNGTECERRRIKQADWQQHMSKGKEEADSIQFEIICIRISGFKERTGANYVNCKGRSRCMRHNS